MTKRYLGGALSLALTAMLGLGALVASPAPTEQFVPISAQPNDLGPVTEKPGIPSGVGKPGRGATSPVPKPPKVTWSAEKADKVEDFNGKVAPPATINDQHLYNGMYRAEATMTAVVNNASIWKPTTGGVANLDAEDYHTLWEMTLEEIGPSGGKNIVEFGFAIVNTGVFGGSGGNGQVRMFASAWYDNGAGGKTWCGSFVGGCGWTDYGSTAPNLGDSLASHVNTTHEFQIVMSGTGIWLAYDGVWVGYFPQHLTHSMSFGDGDIHQSFGELAHNVSGAPATNTTCSDNGNGYLANLSNPYPTSGALVNGLKTELNNSGTYSVVDFTNYNPGSNFDTSKWNTLDSGPSGSFRYGGPGYSAGSC